MLDMPKVAVSNLVGMVKFKISLRYERRSNLMNYSFNTEFRS